jgi:hypothetical protein
LNFKLQRLFCNTFGWVFIPLPAAIKRRWTALVHFCRYATLGVVFFSRLNRFVVSKTRCEDFVPPAPANGIFCEPGHSGEALAAAAAAAAPQSCRARCGGGRLATDACCIVVEVVQSTNSAFFSGRSTM